MIKNFSRSENEKTSKLANTMNRREQTSTGSGFSRRWYLALVVLIIGAIAYSCDKEYLDPEGYPDLEVSPVWALPIINTNVTLEDLLDKFDQNNLFPSGDDNLLYLVYRGNVFSQTAAEAFQIPNQNYSQNITGITIPAGHFNTEDSISFTYSQIISFNAPNGERIDSIHFDEGQIRLSPISDINFPCRMFMEFPGIKKNGTSLKMSTPDMTSPGTIDLQGASMVLTHTGGNTNQFQISYKITIYKGSQNNNSPYTAGFNLDFLNTGFSELFGYLGQPTFDILSDTIDIGIFRNNTEGAFEIAEPRIKVISTNSFGIPVEINFTEFIVDEGKNPPFTQIVNGYPNPWAIASPSLIQIGQDAVTEFDMDKNNSNIEDVLNVHPTRMIYDIWGQGNPSGTVTHNFVQKDSRFDVDVEVELPVYGRASGFVIQDTLDFSLKNTVEQLEWAEFNIFISNGFPVNASVQAYFVDSLDVKIDSLFTTAEQMNVIPGALTGPEPEVRVLAPETKNTIVRIENERVENLIGKAAKIILRARLQTSHDGEKLVKFYADYAMGFRLGIKVKGKQVIEFSPDESGNQ